MRWRPWIFYRRMKFQRWARRMEYVSDMECMLINAIVHISLDKHRDNYRWFWTCHKEFLWAAFDAGYKPQDPITHQWTAAAKKASTR